MNIEVNGVHLDVGDNLREHITESLEAIKDKYFDHVSNAVVFFSKEKHLFKVEIHMNVGRGILLRGTSEGEDAYPAFDSAVSRLGKRLAKYKDKLRDHNKTPVNEVAELLANEVTLQSNDDEPSAKDGHEALVIAEMQTVIEDLCVSDAVMRLELGDLPALFFRNESTGEYNMIYRRKDGNIGWINPKMKK